MKANKYKYISIIIGIFAFACTDNQADKKNTELPIYGEKKIAGNQSTDTLYHTIGDFSFINQFGDTITNATAENKIIVADFFFASCQSICPKMSSQLVHVQNAFKTNDDVILLSHTVNPMHDTVAVLNEYGINYGAIKNKWHLLTGNKKSIYDMARFSYLVNALEDDGSEEGFLHSELFVLVDKQKHIRGFYDGTDSLAVVKLIADIKTLK